MRANQLRLYLSAAAYVLLEAMRRLALEGTAMRTGAGADVSARRVWLSMSLVNQSARCEPHLFDDGSAVGFDDYDKVNQSHHHVSVLQESLRLKPLKIKRSQGLKELRNLRDPSSWLKPGHTRVQRAVFR